MTSNLGRQVCNARKAAKLTQAELAERAGLSRSAVRATEKGQARVSSLDAVLRSLGLELRGRQLISGPVGKALAVARKSRKVGLRELAAALSVSRNTLMAIERGGGLLAIFESYAIAIGARLYLSKPNEPRTFFNHAGNSSSFNGWTTPADLGAALSAAVGGFDIDPCAPSHDKRHARVRAKILLTEADDGLSIPWGVGKKCYVNPPYSRALGKWVAKCHAEARHGSVVVALIPARTDSRYWHDHVAGQADCFLLKGRLKFGAGVNSAPFPSAVIIWGATPDLIVRLSAALIGAWHVPAQTAPRNVVNNYPEAVAMSVHPTGADIGQRPQ